MPFPHPRAAAFLLPAVVFAVALRLPAGDGTEPPPAKDLEATLRKLETDIAEVRGLQFKSPVAAKIIARPGDAARKIQGYYDVKDKTLFVYDDVAGNYERGVLIHEMVHALQDQHFGLARLHPGSFDGDADLARAALIEGDATFTMIQLLQKEQPRVAAMLDVPLEKARDVQQAFLYSQGARYVKALKERGGWGAVNAAYNFPPRSTAAVLHPEGVSAIDLGPGKTRGEFGLIRLLAERPQTAPLAVTAAAGWRGDRLIESGAAQAWVISFSTADGAGRCQSALAKLRREQNPDLKSVINEVGTCTWQDAKGGVVGVLARGHRVLELEAPDEAGYRALLDRVEGPLDLVVYSAKEQQPMTFDTMIDRLLGADLVCVGETHDSDLHHRVQLQIVKALYARDERLGVGMEMFQRPFQAAVDRYLAGEVSEDEFLKSSEYQKRWGYEWTLYRPIVEFCRRNGLPVAALNAPRELTRRISAVGFAGLNDDEKKQLGPIDFQVKEHRDYWYDRLAAMHGKTDVSAEQKERSYQVMTTWDDYMAASAAQFQQGRQLRRLVVLAGAGHIERGFGIPQRAARRTSGKAATVRIEINGDLEKLSADPAADFVVVVRER
jgi:uncharacterized iron-regulated protein